MPKKKDDKKMEEKTRFVNTPMDADLIEKLDIMAQKQENTRAGIVRLAVKKLWREFEKEDPRSLVQSKKN
jgi:metal-responsive CopG/Arc/MetJ family transcriptional regulator